MSKQNWQEKGVRLAGVLVDAAAIVQEALMSVKSPYHRAEIECFLEGGEGSLPSQEALEALEAAIIGNRMMARKSRKGRGWN